MKNENGNFSVFEPLSCGGVNIGDHVEWPNITLLGHASIKNKKSDTAFADYFQNLHVSLTMLNAQLPFLKVGLL